MLSIANRNTIDSVRRSGGAFSIAHSFNFDGFDERFTIPNAQLESLFDGTSDFTLFALVKIDSLSSNVGIFGNVLSTSGVRTVTFQILADGRITIGSYDVSAKSMFSTVGDVTTGSWCLITASIDKSNQSNSKFYLDDTLKTVTGNTLPSTFTTHAFNYAIGDRAADNVSFPFDGNIAMVGAVNRTVIQQEVTDVYNSGNPLSLKSYFGNDCVMFMPADNSTDTAQFTWTGTEGAIGTSVNMETVDKTTDTPYT